MAIVASCSTAFYSVHLPADTQMESNEITETGVQCSVLLFCNLYLLFSDNSSCMSIIYRLMSVL